MKLSTSITARILSGKFRPLLRHMFAAAATSEAVAPVKAAAGTVIGKESLYNTLLKVGSKEGKVADILHGVIEAGNRVEKTSLINCLRDLRRCGRFHLCLEILDWLEKGKYEFTDIDCALRLDILHKIKGLGEVEKYYDSIPSTMKTRYTYGALLHCYCTEPATDKALAIFSEMEEKGFASTVLTFNSLLNLFIKVGQPEKVPDFIADMKHKNVTLNSQTYIYWMQSCRLRGDLEGVERVFHEAEEQELVKSDWVIYSEVASTFIKVDQTEKAVSYLEKLEHVLDNSDKPNRNAYDCLMSLYANAGKLDSVLRVWSKLKSEFKVIKTTNYFALFQALSKLDDIEGLEKYFQEWESTCKSSYDDCLPVILISTYLKHDMVQKAELLLEDCTKKAGKVLQSQHVNFMNYYFTKSNTDGALKHMEIAINSKWKPISQKLVPYFRNFRARKDVDGVEKFCGLLKRVQPLDAIAYSWLLKTYVKAKKTAPDMRRRMEEDGVNITPQLSELLEHVCRN